MVGGDPGLTLALRIRCCQEVGQVRRKEKAASWSRRYKLNVERLASGDLDRVRQAVVELERREQDTGLTPGERRQLARARDIRRRLGGGSSPWFLGPGDGRRGFRRGFPGQVPVDAGAAAGGNVERPQRAARG